MWITRVVQHACVPPDIFVQILNDTLSPALLHEYTHNIR